MNDTFLSRFPKQLGHWAIHGLLNSFPSLIIALVGLSLWRSPQAVAAMLLAILIYIVAFATITSMRGPFSDESHTLGKAVRLGATIRSWIGGISIPLALTPAAFITPDFWCGFIAVAIYNQVDRVLRGAPYPRGISNIVQRGEFLPVFTTTMLEGFIISFLLLMISFFCLIFLQARERRRFLGTSEFS